MLHSKAGIVVFITGYGPFATVKVNPSSDIALRVVENLKRHPDVAEMRYTELDVSVTTVAAYFEKVEREIADIIAEHGAGKVKILLCHLGVHNDTTGLIRVEVQGYNELFASVPDVDGKVLNHEPIVPEDGTIEVFHESWFGKAGSPQLEKLERLIQQVNDTIAESWHHSVTGAVTKNEVTPSDADRKDMAMPAFQAPSWAISRNAGRYLCNCALYHALRLQEKNPGIVYGVFIHVVDPIRGKTEIEGGPIVAYNPTTMVQSVQVQRFMHGLLSLMTT
ncbi:putative pyroglutamyl-peptidase I (PGP) [Leishmania infantum JPCM5]|uniref:Pyroglutamyl-peptidase_I_(C15_family) n=2 Tax=Leishmania infantum TaxID=5671 RepID=A0A6L0XTZ0_LEIIN|nr:putative pyroglutamyl-peptidase I (PGP) [Leishmania infantum JPCM5]CAC9538424.1 pyroglutamyl-peptidase_I_(C15_family) [Leishmania infantum]CAM71631.1 putative pyroglutamyl-peptidase I (PGP) [Leishmania infantum JPCM5]SUZ45557.1 pyroglutamyl-peptidase_I_(C15_family) [Leishmania infantum]|eukprot:XP_001468546.1 putative pyroglutamyl-peptidase I (PGP) [Leishmania infantum JPCM5]